MTEVTIIRFSLIKLYAQARARIGWIRNGLVYVTSVTVVDRSGWNDSTLNDGTDRMAETKNSW